MSDKCDAGMFNITLRSATGGRPMRFFQVYHLQPVKYTKWTELILKEDLFKHYCLHALGLLTRTLSAGNLF